MSCVKKFLLFSAFLLYLGFVINGDIKILLCFSLILLIGLTSIYKLHIDKKLPPGPYGLPLVGCIPFFNLNNLHLQFYRMAKRYGPIFSFKLGSWLAILISDSKIMKEAFTKLELTGRPDIPQLSEYFNYRTLFFDTSKIWLQHKKFTYHCIRMFVAEKGPLQTVLIDETEDLISKLRNLQGSPVYIRDFLNVFFSNVTAKLCFGEKLNSDNYNNMAKVWNMSMDLCKISLILAYFPWLYYIPILGNKINKLFQDIHDTSESVATVIRDKARKYQISTRDSCPSTYLSMYLAEIEKQKSGSKYDFDDTSFMRFMLDVYTAGVTGPLVTMEWCFYNIAHRTEIQSKIQSEIDRVIENERMPEFSDLENMPYTQSVLLEVLRLHSFAALTIPRVAVKTTNIMGYEIPKNSFVVASLYAIHRDPDIWENPKEFLPERFIDPVTFCVKKKHDGFFPFSFGNRICPGESLAQIKILLCLVSVLQKFEIRPVTGKTIDLTAVDNYAMTVSKRQEICFILRDRKRGSE